MYQLAFFVLVPVTLYLAFGKKGKKDHKHQADDAGSDASDTEFYEKQKVHFVEDDGNYVNTLKKELDADLPHFNTLRNVATNNVKGCDYLGTKLGNETWLFPVSQQDLKELYSMTGVDGKMESFPFNQAVGYAPRGMPFIKSTEHWKELRKAIAPIFHSDFMEAYFGYFHTAVKDLVQKWRENNGKVVDIKKDICDMAYDSAVYTVTGAKLDVNVPYHSADGIEELHIRDVNLKTLIDFSKHAATQEFCDDQEYRLKENSACATRLNTNMGTLGGALTGLVEARAAQLADGAEPLKTIVDAAYGLIVAGKIDDVNEAVQSGWAILNGGHSNCGNALAATFYYLLKHPKVYSTLKKEIEDELIKGNKLTEKNLEKVVTHESLHDLEYLSYVVKEALRLSTPIYGKPMKATEDITLESGFTVRKGTVVYPNNAIIGVSENIWENPLEFIPERFDPESPHFKLPGGGKREPITWMPFGAGPRACMGDNFSMYFVKVALVYFMHLFEFELQDVNHEEGFFYWLNEKSFNAKVKTI